MKKLVIIPAYNESENILSTVNDIRDNAPGFDYIVINDCSTDNTLQICREHGIHCIKLPYNLGIGGAVQTGYLYGVRHGYEAAVHIDGDGQHPAAYLKKMVEIMQEQQADMVIGSRFITKEGFQSSKMRRVGILFFTKLIRLMTGKTITDPTSGMRLVNRTVMKMFAADYPKDYPEPESLVRILADGKKVVEMPVVMKERAGGVSSISPVRSIYYMIKVTLAVLLARFSKYREGDIQ